MKLPRGAFWLGPLSNRAITAKAEHDGKVGLTIWHQGFDGDVMREWAAREGWVLSRADVRKLIRMLLKANEIAEGIGHAEKIVRRHS